MEKITISNLSFSYPGTDKPTIDNVSLSVNDGEFITVCGASGSGKSTLLRLLKPPVAPNGEKTGEILIDAEPIEELSLREQTSKIGYLCQDVDAQLVTDKVWHELAFGLENMGESSDFIHRRVAETASFFNLEKYFDYSVNDLSGGLKQLLNLASVMTMVPDVLLLDEPTSQLDPIASSEFISMLKRLNTELGITVILCEHRLEELFPVSDRIIVLENGDIISDAAPEDTIPKLLKKSPGAVKAMPAAAYIWSELDGTGFPCPIKASHGREMLTALCADRPLFPERQMSKRVYEENSVELNKIYFRYGKESPDILKELELSVGKGEFLCLLGGNGAGKSTLLSVIFGSLKPYRGKTEVASGVAMLPQNPLLLLNGKSVIQTLSTGASETGYAGTIKLLKLFDLEYLSDRHPYDLSGGEAQMAALIKLIMRKPKILLLDEPTKGMDHRLKITLASVIRALTGDGVTVIMSSHDIEFCAKYADRCAMLFNGGITSCGDPVGFFSDNLFYTTSARVMSKGLIDRAVTAEEIIYRLTGKSAGSLPDIAIDYHDISGNDRTGETEQRTPKKEKAPRRSVFRLVAGILGAVLLVLGILVNTEVIKTELFKQPLIRYLTLAFPVVLLMLALSAVTGTKKPREKKETEKPKLSRRVIVGCICFCILVPLTLFLGIFFLGEGQYYFISLLILLECMVPFFLVFEGKHPQTRELVTLAALCAIAIGGRAAFFAVPQIKPLLAIVIISGISLGGESGFIVGAVSMLISNIFFGQGIWTPWQMLAAGLIGFLSGLLFRSGILRESRGVICVFGFISTLAVYGGLMNLSTIISVHAPLNLQTLAVYYGQGIPLDLIHAASTFAVLFFLSSPMLEKIERIKTKYGMIE